ncbi:hypothetical protein [Oceaniglobus roseus]|uniref:hypothetical protein n=1 Tax=Oceaniglobus roseus TaxID=1737570 RepID=UPI000C7EED9B|nr:hypothetical protein [Kandeliimicrobium roseum]
MLRKALICFGLCIAPLSPVAAQESCASVVNGELVVFDPSFQAPQDTVSRRERLLSWPGRKLDSLRGRPPACDSQTIIAYLGQTIPADQIDGYCLSEQGEDGFLLLPGERTYNGRCAKTACERVNATKDSALAIAGTAARGAADKALGIEREEPEEAPKSLIHSSGAAILTGTSGYITSNLGAIGSSLTAALSTPAILAATAVTVVAVGGAVYVCSECPTGNATKKPRSIAPGLFFCRDARRVRPASRPS